MTLTISESLGSRARKVVQTHYFVWPQPSDWGRAFEIERYALHGGGSYHLLLDGDKSVCSCLGFESKNYCKHLAALLALQESGDLP